MVYLGYLFQSLSLGCLQGVGQGWGLILRLDLGRIHFQAHGVFGRIQFLAGCWSGSLSSLLTVGQGLS